MQLIFVKAKNYIISCAKFNAAWLTIILTLIVDITICAFKKSF